LKVYVGTSVVGGELIGGSHADLGDIAWVADLWRRVPVYHRSRTWQSDNARVLSVCGRVVIWARDGLEYSRTGLRPDHAARIGRPCLGCYPELRGADRARAARHRHKATTDRRSRPIDLAAAP
jgi:hypothetical protein